MEDKLLRRASVVCLQGWGWRCVCVCVPGWFLVLLIGWSVAIACKYVACSLRGWVSWTQTWTQQDNQTNQCSWILRGYLICDIVTLNFAAHLFQSKMFEILSPALFTTVFEFHRKLKFMDIIWKGFIWENWLKGRNFAGFRLGTYSAHGWLDWTG